MTLNGFQIVGLGLIGALTALVLYRASTSRGRGWGAWLLVCIAAVAALLSPERTTTLAAAVGIGRGADLVLYSFCLASLFAFFFLYVRQRRTEQELTKLVRQVAIDQAMRDNDDPGGAR